jgi:DNA modification methylase
MSSNAMKPDKGWNANSMGPEIEITKGSSKYEGWGTALKPAAEYIVMARKPLSEKTIVDNVIKWGTGGINVDGCRIEGLYGSGENEIIEGKEASIMDKYDNTRKSGAGMKQKIMVSNDSGRFPANILFDETAAEMLDEQSGILQTNSTGNGNNIDGSKNINIGGGYTKPGIPSSKGGASRFFFNAKNYGGREDFFIYKEKNIIIWNTKSLNTQEYKMEECIEVSDALRQARENILQKPELYGNNTMVKYLLNTISITKMKTHSIMTFSILNVYTKMNIGHFTLMIEEKQSHLLMEENILNVQIVNNQNALVSSIKTNQEVLATIVNYVLEEDLENGETVIENTIINTTENTEQSRFRYVAKVGKKERNLGLDDSFDKETKGYRPGEALGGQQIDVIKKNTHPTLKPINLMTYLCRLITPPGGIVLDPFMGSGSTGISACLEGFRFVGMELDEDYFKIAEARVNNFEEYRKLLKK